MSTVDDIRASLDRREETASYHTDGWLLRYGRALRAVLDIHQPNRHDGLCDACLLDGQDLDEDDPACETVRRIRDELGVPHD